MNIELSNPELIQGTTPDGTAKIFVYPVPQQKLFTTTASQGDF